MPAPATPEAIRDVNVRYHDAAADHYDGKWGVDFGEVGRAQVLGKVRKLLGPSPGPFAHALEVGAGTGYFSLNLLAAGVVRRATATDISPGMLSALEANAARLGLPVTTRAVDAERLPFEDATFDLVLGHAVLHHLPDLDQAFREMHRVLRPGGTVFFAGEPSRVGDRIATVPKRAAGWAAPAWRALMNARPATAGHSDGGEANHQLEGLVDVHAVVPDDLQRSAVRAGLTDVQVRGEELLANWFGWANRALEATAEQDDVPWLWRQYAYRGYLFLQEVDRRVLESRLHQAIFYKLLLSARKPG